MLAIKFQLVWFHSLCADPIGKGVTLPLIRVENKKKVGQTELSNLVWQSGPG